ncbi:zinc finger MYM-type protein 1-like [Sipha flava]|uniref:Zinc finger MYM-type protein 1-like n=1 Tax=Sipha flava TaxID=143950 RepID=A0A8B8FT89_9HEMI|nr:zinc finger MYM-type protein 1-like [Sipha flava]
MSSRQRDKYRKFDSGYQKRVNKLKLEQNLKKQRGALNKFVLSPNIPERVAEVQNEIENYEEKFMSKSDTEQPGCSKEYVTQNSNEVVDKDSGLSIDSKIVNKREARIDFSDPAQWPQSLNHDMRVEIVLSKSEKIEFYETVLSWNELKTRIIKNETIDDVHLKEIDKKKQYWKDVLKRILSAIFYLAKHGDEFRRSSDVIYTEHNGKFLGLIEMMAKFDPVIQEHVRRIKNNETHDHYLSHQIQDELIELIAQKIRQQIVEEIKEAKYFSIMMDCTPDVSREEQLSIIIRILDMGNKIMSTIPCIKEYFIEFINVHNTTGYDLTNILLDKLNSIGIDLKDCHGQAYDNGANMKGQYKGVQSRIIAKNPRAFFSPCACHNLNLLLGDIAKSSTVAVGFFGTIQRIYCLFASSIKRWDILKKHCTFLTLKPLSETRWECKVNSFKAIRYQVPELFRALEEVAYTTSDPKTKSEAQSLASNKLESYEFILSLVIWYEILIEKQFDYKNSDEINDDPEKNFRTFYFNVIADGALSSFSERFNQFQIYNNNFSFLYNIIELRKITNDDIMKNCLNLQNYLSDGDSYDIVASEFYEELLVFRHTMKEDSTPIGALSFF